MKLHKNSRAIPFDKGVKQGDTISPKLFTASLEDIFRHLDWKNRGISINGQRVSNLRFADDGTLIAENLEDLESCLNEQAEESSRRGLKINIDTTKVLSNDHVTHWQV